MAKRRIKTIKGAKARARATVRLKKINAIATAEQKKSGVKTKTVKTYKLDRKTALKRAGKKYKKLK